MVKEFHLPHNRLFESEIVLRAPENFDTVRGVVCLLLVAYHVVGNTSARGLKLPASSDWHYVMASFDLIRMPIFTILSGFLYGQHRIRFYELSTFAFKKLRRLGLPLIAMTVLTVAGHHLFYGESFNLLLPLTARRSVHACARPAARRPHDHAGAAVRPVAVLSGRHRGPAVCL
jgi:hypothetical protein